MKRVLVDSAVTKKGRLTLTYTDLYSREEVMDKVEDVHNKIKRTAFGKTKQRTRKAQTRDVIDDTTDEVKAEMLKIKETERIQTEIAKVKATGFQKSTK